MFQAVCLPGGVINHHSEPEPCLLVLIVSFENAHEQLLCFITSFFSGSSNPLLQKVLDFHVSNEGQGYLITREC
jgi:hypothetical protein